MRSFTPNQCELISHISRLDLILSLNYKGPIGFVLSLSLVCFLLPLD